MTTLPIGTASMKKFASGQCGRCGAAAGEFAADRDSVGSLLGEVEGTALCANCLRDQHFRIEPTAEKGEYGDLMDYETGDYIRPATKQEREQSDAEVATGHHEGVIVVDWRREG